VRHGIKIWKPLEQNAGKATPCRNGKEKENLKKNCQSTLYILKLNEPPRFVPGVKMNASGKARNADRAIK